MFMFDWFYGILGYLGTSIKPPSLPLCSPPAIRPRRIWSLWIDM
jgi:hypothetical protein